MRALEADVALRGARVTEPDSVAAATAAKGGVRGATLLKVWLPVPLLLLLLDVTFNLWFWHVPKLSNASADYGYQFLLDAHDLSAAPKGANEVRVLALGSSVAGAFDPAQIQGLLRAGGASSRVAVHRLMLPGIKPSDLRLYLATEGAGLRPDVAVVLLNPLDFMNPSFERDLKPQVRYVLPPWDTLRERSAFIPTVSGKLDLALASVSNLYRYRKLIRSSIEDHAQLALRWLRGASSARGYGWYADGHTRQHFGLPIEGGVVELDYFVDPEWLRQRGLVTLQFATARGLFEQRTEREPGWKQLRVTLPADSGPLLHVSADSAWSPRAAGRDRDTRLLGVRLRAIPAGGGAVPEHPPVHYPPLERTEPDQLLRMGGAQGEAFERRWQSLLEADTEFGRRFRAYRDSKLAARPTPIDPEGETAELDRLVELLTANGARVVLVNNPESPLLRRLYEDSPHYQSYLAFLRGVAARHPRTAVHDLRAALPLEDFNDWHHVTYIGAIKLGPVYAGLLRPLVEPAAAGS